MKMPLIVVNFKTYPNTIGKNGLEMAKKIERVSKDTGINFAIAASAPDIRLLSENVDIPVFAQHCEPNNGGRGTGTVTVSMIKEAGAAGTLLNHSENQIPIEKIRRIREQARGIGLKVIICADSAESAAGLAQLQPDAIAVEPPELIETGLSVSKAQPDVLIRTASLVRKVPFLCGAGISSKDDVKLALKYGSKGVLLASAVIKAQDPEAKLRELAQGVKRREKQ